MKMKGLLIGTEGVLCTTSHLHLQAWECVCAENGIDYFPKPYLDCASNGRAEQLQHILAAAGLDLSEAEKQCVCQRKSVAKGLPKSEHLSTP